MAVKIAKESMDTTRHAGPSEGSPWALPELPDPPSDSALDCSAVIFELASLCLIIDLENFESELTLGDRYLNLVAHFLAH